MVDEGGPRCLSCGSTASEPWATSTDVEYRTTTDRFTYRRCSRCNVLFIDPVPVDRLAEIYPSTYYSYSDEGESRLRRIKERLDRRHFASVLARLPGDSLSVLDVGGGVGRELSIVRASDPRVTRGVVVDLDERSAPDAAARGHEFACSRIEDFTSDRQFDLVLLLNLIEHVEDPRGVLENVRDLLAEHGLILVKTPNTKSLDARIFRNHDWGGYHCPRHWVLFDRDSFTRLADETGLRVDRMSFTQGAPFWSTSVLAALSRRRLVRITTERPMTSHPLFGPLAAGFAVFDLARKPVSRPSQMFFELSRRE